MTFFNALILQSSLLLLLHIIQVFLSMTGTQQHSPFWGYPEDTDKEHYQEQISFYSVYQRAFSSPLGTKRNRKGLNPANTGDVQAQLPSPSSEMP